MSKKSKVKHQQHTEKKNVIHSVYFSIALNKFKENTIIAISILIALFTSIWYVVSAFNTNSFLGFPLDDPWIHLTFAKNLIEYGSFSYFKNEAVTSGSTSPIYTLLLSLFYAVSKNEYIISYIIGILFLAASVFFYYRLTKIEFVKENWIPVAAMILLAFQPKLDLISVSGMETTMFIFLLIASFYYYKKRNFVLLGIFSGLTLWCRPDGLILWIAIAVDIISTRILKTNADASVSNKSILKYYAISIGFLIAYCIFNFALSGNYFPNTYAAKLAYYGDFSRTNFIKEEVIGYFSSKEFLLLSVPFVLGFIIVLIDLLKRNYNKYLIYLLFVLGFIFAYYIQLPFGHRFGRYLMPVIPFYIILSLYGMREFFEVIQKGIKANYTPLFNFISVIIIILTLILSLNTNNEYLKEFSGLNKYHHDRHVAAGMWINKNTPENAVIATHDIGAIGFYGNRKIIDMVGLVTPEVVSHINDKNFNNYLTDYFVKHKTDYIVTLRNWFQVVNDNPLYVPTQEFEVLEVYKFKPGQTLIAPREVGQRNDYAYQQLQTGNIDAAIYVLDESLKLEPRNSKTYTLLGLAYDTKGDRVSAEKYYNQGLQYFNESFELNFALGRLKFLQKDYSQAKTLTEKSLKYKPDFKPAQDLLREIEKNS